MKDFIAAFFLGLIMPVALAIKIVVLFNLTDFIFGVSAALISKEKFSSLKMLRFVLKVVCVFAILISIGQLQAYLDATGALPAFINVVSIVSGAIVFYELKSIGKNATPIFGFDFYENILSKIQGIRQLDPDANKETPTTPADEIK